MPARWSRRASQVGVGAAGSKPVTVRAAKTGQPAASSTSTGYPSAFGAGTSRSAGSWNADTSPMARAASRATPRSDSA